MRDQGPLTICTLFGRKQKMSVLEKSDWWHLTWGWDVSREAVPWRFCDSCKPKRSWRFLGTSPYDSSLPFVQHPALPWLLAIPLVGLWGHVFVLFQGTRQDMSKRVCICKHPAPWEPRAIHETPAFVFVLCCLRFCRERSQRQTCTVSLQLLMILFFSPKRESTCPGFDLLAYQLEQVTLS